MANGGGRHSLKQGTLMAQQKSVTLVISHVLDPEHGQAMKRGWAKLCRLRQSFPAILAQTSFVRPGQNLWSVIIRFDTIEHLYAWTQSETRRQLVAEIARC
jgi:antibiotic biosynthesis monooxygenase (ABM) superfamily enzyme